MRVGVGRVIACGVVLPLAVAAVASAQPMPAPAPPDVKVVDTAGKRAELQAELLALLKKMSANPTPPMTTPVTPVTVTPTTKDGKTEPPVGGGPDRVREAMNLFRDNRLEAARIAFDQMPVDAMPREDKAFVRYMLATCHRRLGNITRAQEVYREVANSGDDEFLAGYASQQLYLINSERELQSQLEQIRPRVKSK